MWALKKEKDPGDQFPTKSKGKVRRNILAATHLNDLYYCPSPNQMESKDNLYDFFSWAKGWKKK